MNTFERFQKYVTDKVAFRSSDWEQVRAVVHHQTVATNELVIREGEVCRHLYFLDQGLLRFFQWIDGEDRTKFFT